MCIVPQVGFWYETREGYQAFVAGANPFTGAAKKYVGWCKDFDGNIVAVEWHGNGHFNSNNAPNEYDLESEPIAIPVIA